MSLTDSMEHLFYPRKSVVGNGDILICRISLLCYHFQLTEYCNNKFNIHKSRLILVNYSTGSHRRHVAEGMHANFEV